LEAWLAHRRGARDCGGGGSDAERPLFCAVSKSGTDTVTTLSDKAVVRLVKQAALDAGLDPAGFSGHSLRAGLATAAAAGDAGAGLPELMRQTRRKSTSVALGYALLNGGIFRTISVVGGRR
jgi:integrase